MAAFSRGDLGNPSRFDSAASSCRSSVAFAPPKSAPPGPNWPGRPRRSHSGVSRFQTQTPVLQGTRVDRQQFDWDSSLLFWALGFAQIAPPMRRRVGFGSGRFFSRVPHPQSLSDRTRSRLPAFPNYHDTKRYDFHSSTGWSSKAQPPH